jgi:hypothetical protein
MSIGNMLPHYHGATMKSQPLKSQNQSVFRSASFGNLDEIMIRINSGNVIKF